MKRVCRLILRLVGWRITGLSDLPNKCVICVAPHTSNWDLLLGLVVYRSMGRKASFLMKKEWFFFPLGFIFRGLGGIPVDRSKKSSLTEQMAEIYAKDDKFQLAITPEATRKLNSDWKKGFYYIALAANVPILIAILDYGKKEAIFEATLMPSGDADTDMQKIKSYYINATAKHPECFSL